MAVEESIVIPAYNEAKRLPPYLEAIRRYFGQAGQRTYEVIVVDDGSEDDLDAAVQNIAQTWPELVFLHHDRNRGKGAAVRTGVMAARGSLLLITDADGATPIEEEANLRQALSNGADVAIGSRLVSASHVYRERSWYRRESSCLFAWLGRHFLHLGVRDTQCGFKMFRREAALHILNLCREEGYLLDLELLARAKQLGYHTTEVPVCWKDVAGSKVCLVRDGLRMLRGLWNIKRGLKAIVPVDYPPAGTRLGARAAGWLCLSWGPYFACGISRAFLAGARKHNQALLKQVDEGGIQLPEKGNGLVPLGGQEKAEPTQGANPVLLSRPNGSQEIPHGTSLVNQPRNGYRVPGSCKGIVPTFLGGVLLLAAALKCHRLLSGRVPDHSVWLDPALIQVELIFGAALVGGLFSQFFRWGALILFSAFLGISFHHGASGAKSCGCLGDVPLQPWYAFAFDLGAVGALWFWRPVAQSSADYHWEQDRRGGLGYKRGLSLAVPLIPCLAPFPFLIWAAAQERFPRLQVHPQVLNVGTLKQAERRAIMIAIRNPHPRPVFIKAVQVSCPCVEAQHLPWTFEPGEELWKTLVLDLGKEPTFSGRLSIEIEARSLSDDTAFRAWLELQVVPPTQSAEFQH